MNILEFRKGNLVEYGGPFGFQRVLINEVQEAKDGSQAFTLTTLYNPPEVFTGYSVQISPIYFREYHLEGLKFTKDKETGRYSKDGLILSAYMFIEGKDWFRMTGGYTNFFVIPKDLDQNPTLEHLKKHGTEIPNVHSFQNYCTDNNIPMDFKPLF